MTGIGSNDEAFDKKVFEAIRDAYSDVHLPVALADIQHPRQRSREAVMATRIRMALAAAVAVTVATVGTWLLVGQGNGGVQPMPADSPTSTTTETAGKPARPTSSATTDPGTCADHGQAVLDADPSQAGNQVMPPLRLTLGQDPTRLLVYGADNLALTCWLSADMVVVEGSDTAVNAQTYPPGQLSYSSEDSGRGWGGAAFGRVPAGTTEVTISFPSGPDAVATIVGEWYGYFAPPGPDNDRLAEATKVTAVTPTGSLSQPIQHG